MSDPVWLVVGHGSVGSALVRRLNHHGIRPAIFDPQPRHLVEGGEAISDVTAYAMPFTHVMSCVTPSAARDVAEMLAPAVGPGTLYWDWNTVSPACKRDLVHLLSANVIDVALLDTLDEVKGPPTLAVSGRGASAGATTLTDLGFRVEIVGDYCGDAALLKFARSLFMKTLEALVIEFEALTIDLDRRDVVVASIDRNLGEEFRAFSNLLLRTDRLHARRRVLELEAARDVYMSEGPSLRLAAAAVDVLHQAAAAWDRTDAPPVTADQHDLAKHLRRALRADR